MLGDNKVLTSKTLWSLTIISLEFVRSPFGDRMEIFMYARENYEKAREIIDSRRRAAEASADERCAEMRALSPEIATIDTELSRTGLELFGTACRDGDLAPLRARNEELQKRRRELIVSLGYPEDYTDLKCTCSLCADSGYNGTNICNCMKELIVTMNIESSGMGRVMGTQSFDNFDLEWYRESGEEDYRRMAHNFKVAREYADNFGKEPKNLLLIGSTGTGKTHLSSSIARAIISRGFDVLYDTAQNIVEAFRNDQFYRNASNPESEADKFLLCDLLIVDDLGAEFVNPFSVSALYNLINTRQNRGLSTIISTNLSAEELAGKYDGRIYSRIVGCDYTVLFFKGKDHRVFR